MHHILHREWPRENVHVPACIVTIQNSNRQRRESPRHGLLVYTGDRRAGESLRTLPESETKFAFGFGPARPWHCYPLIVESDPMNCTTTIPPDAHLRTFRRLRSGNRILAVRDYETPSRSRQSQLVKLLEIFCRTCVPKTLCAGPTQIPVYRIRAIDALGP